MKSYFISFDFWNRDFNKFHSGIIKADLRREDFYDVVKNVIRDNYPEIDPDSVTISVKSFNNVQV